MHNALDWHCVSLQQMCLQMADAVCHHVMHRQGAASYAALPHAARRGHIPVLQALLRRGANPWSSDSDGYSAWDYALDHAKPPALVQVLLENDLTFAKQQQHFQAQYGRLCAMLKRTQRYPALGCPCRTCNSMVEIRAPESEASRSVSNAVGHMPDGKGICQGIPSWKRLPYQLRKVA